MDHREVSFKEVDNCSEDLNNLANYLFLNPEVAFKETKAHDYICQYLESKGFQVERHFLHNTGFRAIHETKPKPHFAILVEYDALPGFGHACGHNIIAQSSVGTAIGFKAAMDKGLGCKISVLGTPAEEGGGGKLKFVSEGIFADIDVAIMSHPFACSVVLMPCLAIMGLTISFFGKEAHASANPWDGKNALDAAVLAYQGISCLRQQTHPDYRIHGIITKGGEAPNIIPDKTEMQYYVRANTSRQLNEYLKPVYACFESAAKMTGCELKIEISTPRYEELIHNKVLAEIYTRNATKMGISFYTEDSAMRGSTDAGNVSQVCPTLHPLFYIGTSAILHTKEFAIGAGKEEACSFGILQAKIMISTLLDIMMDETGDVLERIKLDLQQSQAHN